MPTDPIICLSWVELTIAAGLIVAAGVLSLILRLRLERSLALAAARTIVQLLLIGYVLRAVFEIDNGLLLVGVVTIMLVAAARAASQRSSRRFPGMHRRALLALALSSLATTVTATTLIIGVEPWYAPQYLIPLLGMVLGNQLNGVSLALDRFLAVLAERRDEIEMELAHGATRWEAARDALREAVRNGMTPIINSMMVVGIVALPGMMTGQILAGADPIIAVKYQIVIMFMIAAATSVCCTLVTLLAFHRLFNADHQLVTDAITARKP